MMKNVVLIIVGLLLLALVIIFPLPTMLAISGVVWRIIIGFFGCILIYKTVRKK